VSASSPVSSIRAAALEAVGWLDERLSCADPWRGDSLDTAGLQAFAEYTILAGALADSGTRLGGDAEFVSERWLSAAEEVISRPDYVDVVRRRPLQSFMYLLPYLVLRRVGRGSVRMDDQLVWLLDRGLLTAPEQTPFRELDLAYFLESSGHPLPGPGLVERAHRTFAFRAPGPDYLDAAAAYSITHTILYLSDFGRRPLGPVLGSVNRLIDLVDASVVTFWRSGHWDLLAESLTCRSVLSSVEKWPPWIRRSIESLLTARRSDGSIAGHRDVDTDAAGQFGDFDSHYHTTLVVALLGAVVSFGDA